MFRPLKGHLSGVSNYTLLITELQREIPIFLSTYIGHKVATHVYLHTIEGYWLILNLTIKIKLILISE
jgi:hypothetical protein